MTPQEAIEALKLINLKRVHPFYSWEEMLEVRNIAIESLEKQIPKKATEKTTNRGIDITGEYDIDFDLCCPICGAVVGTFEGSENEYFVKHCDNCGQKLLWESDTE